MLLRAARIETASAPAALVLGGWVGGFALVTWDEEVAVELMGGHSPAWSALELLS